MQLHVAYAACLKRQLTICLVMGWTVREKRSKFQTQANTDASNSRMLLRVPYTTLYMVA
jgi:hypothetical protein